MSVDAWEAWKKEKEAEFTIKGVALPVAVRHMLTFYGWFDKQLKGGSPIKCNTCSHWTFTRHMTCDICPVAHPGSWSGEYPACSRYRVQVGPRDISTKKKRRAAPYEHK